MMYLKQTPLLRASAYALLTGIFSHINSDSLSPFALGDNRRMISECTLQFQLIHENHDHLRRQPITWTGFFEKRSAWRTVGCAIALDGLNGSSEAFLRQGRVYVGTSTTS